MYTQTKTHIIAERLKVAGEEGVELARQLIEAVFSCSVITSDWEGSFILNLYKGKGEPLAVATIVISSSQIKSWSCTNRNYILHPWDGEYQRDAAWLCAWQRHHWRHIRCSPAAGELHRSKQTTLLCLCRPSESLWSCFKEGPMVGFKGATGLRNGLCMSFKSCTPMPRVVCRSIVSTIMSLAWELMCIRTLPLAHYSSSRCWRCFHMSSALVCCGSSSSLTTSCSSQTPRRCVSPSSRHGRQVWKVKSSLSTWRRPIRPSSWFLVLAMLSSRNLASTPVLPALGLSATTQLSAHSACGGSTRSALASLSKQLVAASNYVCRRCKGEARPINGRTVDIGGTMLDVEATFCYLCDILCSSAIAATCCVASGKFRKLLSVLTARYLSPRICGKVYEACVCPNN